MRTLVSLSRALTKSLPLVAALAAAPALAAPVQNAKVEAHAKGAKVEAKPVTKKAKGKAQHAAKKPARHRRHGAAKEAPKVVAKHTPRAEAKGEPKAVAIVDATPLRFAPHVEEGTPEAPKKAGEAKHADGPKGADAKAAEGKLDPSQKDVAEAPKGDDAPKASGKQAKGGKGKKGAKAAPKPPCLREAVHVERFEEKESFSLLTCEGAPAPHAIERLSVLARPGGLALPAEPVDVLAKRKGEVLAPGVKRLDLGLLERLQSVVDKLRPKATASLSVISGYRPASKGSLHAEGQAIDFSLAGATNTELVEACKTLDDTGCGFYPNSSFIHMDVRPKGAGHVSWIDASGPGEEARYVSTWPLSPNDARRAKAAQGIDLQERQGREWHRIPADERHGVAASTAAPIAMPEEPSER